MLNVDHIPFFLAHFLSECIHNLSTLLDPDVSLLFKLSWLFSLLLQEIKIPSLL